MNDSEAEMYVVFAFRVIKVIWRILIGYNVCVTGGYMKTV